jgi:hypothetical protein
MRTKKSKSKKVSKKVIKKVTVKSRKVVKPRKFGENAAFIRSQPDSMTAKEVSIVAAKRGLKISVNHVYNLRAAAQKKSGVKVGRGRRGASSDDDVLRAAIANIGLKRAREILTSFESAVLA